MSTWSKKQKKAAAWVGVAGVILVGAVVINGQKSDVEVFEERCQSEATQEIGYLKTIEFDDGSYVATAPAFGETGRQVGTFTCSLAETESGREIFNAVVR